MNILLRRDIVLLALAIGLWHAPTTAVAQGEGPPESQAAAATKEEQAEVLALYKEAERLKAAGKREEAIATYERAIEAARKVHGPDHRDTTTFLNNLAVLLMETGESAKAEPILLEVIQSIERREGAESPELLQMVANLAMLYYNGGQREKGEPHGRRCLALFEVRHADDPAQATETLLDTVGWLYAATGDAAKSEQALLASIKKRESRLGADHLQVAQSLHSLAGILLSQGLNEKAEAYFQRGQEVFASRRKANDPDLVPALTAAAANYEMWPEHNSKAVALLQQAVEVQEERLGAEHVELVPHLDRLARVLELPGVNDDAQALRRRSLALLEAHYGVESLPAAEGASNLAATLIWQSDYYDEAEALLLRVLRVREAALGPDHPDVRRTVGSLSYLYELRKLPSESQTIAEKRLPLVKRLLAWAQAEQAERPANVAHCSTEVAKVLEESGRYREAIPYRESVLAYWEKSLGHYDNGVYVMDWVSKLARSYQGAGQYHRAEPLFRRVLTDREQRHGADSPELCGALESLGRLYQDWGRFDAAVEQFARVLAIKEIEVGAEHRYLVRELVDLARAREQQRQFAEAEQLMLRNLKIREQNPGERGYFHEAGIKQMAEFYDRLDRHGEAEKYWSQRIAFLVERDGPEHASVREAEFQLARRHQSLGEFSQSLAILRRIVDRDTSHKEGEYDLLVSLAELMIHYFKVGDNAQARALVDRIVALEESQFDNLALHKSDWLEAHAVALYEAGERQKTLNSFKFEAERNFWLARELFPKLVGRPGIKLTTADVDKVVAKCELELGCLLYDQQDFPVAETLLLSSLNIFAQDQESYSGRIRSGGLALAALYSDQGRRADALPLVLWIASLEEKAFGADDPQLAPMLEMAATLYSLLGRDAEAEPIQRRILKLLQASLPADDPQLTEATLRLANILHNQGHYAAAEPLYQQVVAHLEADPVQNTTLLVDALSGQAGLYSSLGQYSKAAALLERGVALVEAEGGVKDPRLGLLLQSLGWERLQQRQGEQAVLLYLRALELMREKLASDDPQIISCMEKMFLVVEALGHFEKAEAWGLQTLELKQAKFGPASLQVADTLESLAGLYQRKGDLPQAKALYAQSGVIFASLQGQESPRLVTALVNLGVVLAQSGDLDLAVTTFDDARRLRRRHVGRVLGGLSEREQLLFLKEQDQDSVWRALACGLLARELAGAAERSAAWLLNSKGLANETLAQRSLLLRESADPDATSAARELLAVRGRLAQLSLNAAQPGQEAQRGAELDRLSQQEEALSKQLAQLTGEPASAKSWVELAEVQSRLPTDAVFIDLARFEGLSQTDKDWVAPPRYAAWLTRATGPVQVVDLGPAEAIESAVAELRQQIQGSVGAIRQEGEPAAEEALRPALDKLARLVLRPLEPLVAKDAQWWISPDGALWLAPWAALPLADGRYAIEGHAIHYLTSGRDLTRARTTHAGGKPLILADPDYDLDQTRTALEIPERPSQRGPETRAGEALPTRWPRLPGTAAEAKAIAPRLQIYAGAAPDVLTRREATEEALQSARGPHTVVLSTHGFFLPDQTAAVDAPDAPPVRAGGERQALPPNPLLRCGLVLAGANHRGARAGEFTSDGILTGLEIVGTDLRGTGLVVLSACETGLGEVQNGEGVAGLRQALQLAGAESVLATLWQIPDQESARLMADFFDQLAQGKDRSAALRAAQLGMIRSRRDQYGAAHPFFWAAFTLTGGTE